MYSIDIPTRIEKIATEMDVISTMAGTLLLQREEDNSLYVLLVICDINSVIVFLMKKICSECV